eukprot:gnl/TRDRNA2_/TRDRNA2_42468_c0_seq1.p1 gnl/TRDRNA2_/TRDRNA2_42468_c0~~gnl/TRDRNA2_/TRDRNA2_42468_c0_seq1.p1  ORF type:complete len:199 (+),score=41.05 gnl/TRDRNA2_/TRDRNA2_42468_c0_seq1:29-625(+)
MLVARKALVCALPTSTAKLQLRVPSVARPNVTFCQQLRARCDNDGSEAEGAQRQEGCIAGEDTGDGAPSPVEVESAAARRRRKLMEEAADNNPFVAAQMHGVGVGASEASIRKYIKDGHLDDLAGKGKPLPYRAPPPFVDDEEHRLQGVADRMLKEFAHDLEDGEWRKAFAKSEIQQIKATQQYSSFGSSPRRKGGIR